MVFVVSVSVGGLFRVAVAIIVQGVYMCGVCIFMASVMDIFTRV